MVAEVYASSHIKRERATKAQMIDRLEALGHIVALMQPMTVRQCFYAAVVRSLIEKTEAGYIQVQRALAQLRRSGALPYGWIVDNTRWMRKPRTFDNIGEALRDTAILYRKALWRDADRYCEIWLEKDALAGVVYPITSEFDVPLMVTRGYASLSFLASAAADINELKVPSYIYHLGDFDPSGVNAGEKIEQTLRELAPNAEIHFERIAVTPAQIRDWNLPTRPTKKTDSRAKGFSEISVELDAIDPDTLRALVRSVIEQHLPPDQLNILKIAERSERALFSSIADILDPNIEDYVAGADWRKGLERYEARVAGIKAWINRGISSLDDEGAP
jgi:hypothetical protein